jgi:hypothetical protein
MTCKTSGKFQYESRALAEGVVNRKRRVRKKHKHGNNLDTKEVSVYKCTFCGYYHIAGRSKH